MSTHQAAADLPRHVMGIWPHPDDEAYLSAGLMARMTDADRRVTVLTLTRVYATMSDEFVSRNADLHQRIGRFTERADDGPASYPTDQKARTLRPPPAVRGDRATHGRVGPPERPAAGRTLTVSGIRDVTVIVSSRARRTPQLLRRKP
jgi:hypothetical protein